MRAVILILMTMPLAGCLTTSNSDVSPARIAWGDCVWAAVGRLDDGKSDPVSIATGISPVCAVQYQHLTDLMVDRDFISTTGAREDMRERMKDAEIKLITAAILTHRAGRSANQVSPDFKTSQSGN